jgi:pyruvate,water dikinase
MGQWIRNLSTVSLDDVASVGGKNAALGEMIQALSGAGVPIPPGFVITAEAFRLFLQSEGLLPSIERRLQTLSAGDGQTLAQVGAQIRQQVMEQPLPKELETQILQAYRDLRDRAGEDLLCAVRSSATAEDLPDASFAGQHDTALGVRGEEALLHAVRYCMASVYNDRAIHYRIDKGFDHSAVALSVGVQQLVRSDLGGSGILFTCDPDSGFEPVVVINAIRGLGELIVQGEQTPDELLWFKPLLDLAPLPQIGKRLGTQTQKMILRTLADGTMAPEVVATTPHEQASFVLEDQEARQLAQWGVQIEQWMSKRHGRLTPMDIEWAKDGQTGKLWIVQARPETVQSRRDLTVARSVRVLQPGQVLAEGVSVGQSAAVGRARLIPTVSDIGSFQQGEILVTSATDPDWEPIMKKAAGIITERGGRTSHAAIVSRELGVPAIVGAENALQKIGQGADITLDATSAKGFVYAGRSKIEVLEHSLGDLAPTRTKIMLNLATPDTAFEKGQLPVAGVGLAREEFIIASRVGIHPMAALHPEQLEQPVRIEVERRSLGWATPREFYVATLAYGIGQIAAAFYPRPVIARFSDFKTNEYRELLGGAAYEPHEENPMLGWRGASRYEHPDFQQAFQLECEAMRRVREQMGLVNLIPMVPFCRTPEEGRGVLRVMQQAGICTKAFPGQESCIPVYMMCELPSNVVLAEEFLDLFDGFSIGSNDLTQLVLGVDRDSPALSQIGSADHPAVRQMIAEAIAVCRKRGCYNGICGQDPSDLPGFVAFLVECGIESISLNPDALFKTWQTVLEAESHPSVAT